jgi:hypothetical protein
MWIKAFTLDAFVHCLSFVARPSELQFETRGVATQCDPLNDYYRSVGIGPGPRIRADLAGGRNGIMGYASLSPATERALDRYRRGR